MKRLILTTAAIFFVIQAWSQDTLKLENCLSLAENRSPLTRQKDISAQVMSNRIKNLTNNWYPTVGLNAQALYNSETIDFSDVFSNMPVPVQAPSLPLDQYKVWAEINQQIFDGGAIKAMKEAEKSENNSTIRQTEADLLNVRQQVSQIYFSLLIAQKNDQVLNVTLDELSARRKVVESGVQNGIILSENLLAIDAEIINIRQKLTELNLLRKQMIGAMSVLLDSTISPGIVVTGPGDPILNESAGRPEFLMFDSQKERLAANQKLAASADMPKLYAFSQLAYGRPGFNMTSTDFHTFYSVGAGLKWNFLNYGDTRRQKKILEMQKDLVDIKRENFDNQLQIQLLSEKSNMEKYDSLILNDEQILAIRKAIAESSLSKLKNGIIRSTDYLTDLNAEVMAKLQYENHKILRIQSAYNYAMLQGKY
jgi:outer membrane protein TolC